MAVITIPFDYDERTHPTIVPICIADTDSEGKAVHRGWIELGVAPVVDRQRLQPLWPQDPACGPVALA